MESGHSQPQPRPSSPPPPPTKRPRGRPNGSKDGPNAGKNGRPIGRSEKDARPSARPCECQVVARTVPNADRRLPSPGHKRRPHVQGQPCAACACPDIDQNGATLNGPSTAMRHIAGGSRGAEDERAQPERRRNVTSRSVGVSLLFRSEDRDTLGPTNGPDGAVTGPTPPRI